MMAASSTGWPRAWGAGHAVRRRLRRLRRGSEMNKTWSIGWVVLAASLWGACLQAAEGGGNARGASAILGIWVPDAAPRQLLTADGKAPPLNDEAGKLYAQRKRQYETGDRAYDQT